MSWQPTPSELWRLGFRGLSFFTYQRENEHGDLVLFSLREVSTPAIAILAKPANPAFGVLYQEEFSSLEDFIHFLAGIDLPF